MAYYQAFRVPRWGGMPINLCELSLWLSRCKNLYINDETLYDSMKHITMFQLENISETKATNAPFSWSTATSHNTHEYINAINLSYHILAATDGAGDSEHEMIKLCNKINKMMQNPMPIIEPYRCFSQLSSCMHY